MIKKNQKETVTLTLILIAFMAISLFTLYQTEIKNKPIIEEKIKSKDLNYIYNFYTSPTPNIDEKPFFGSDKAAVNIISYIDINSPASKYFMEEIFPKLDQEYINTGYVKFYAKHPLTIKDFNEKNEKFTYAKTLLCINEINPKIYYPFYFDLFKIKDAKEINELIPKHNIKKEEYDSCMKEESGKLKEDISETENFGIVGMNARFYIGIDGINFKVLDGIPNYRKFNRTIKDYGIMIGN